MYYVHRDIYGQGRTSSVTKSAHRLKVDKSCGRCPCNRLYMLTLHARTNLPLSSARVPTYFQQPLWNWRYTNVNSKAVLLKKKNVVSRKVGGHIKALGLRHNYDWHGSILRRRSIYCGTAILKSDAAPQSYCSAAILEFVDCVTCIAASPGYIYF